MESRVSIFCFICLLLIISSLYHLFIYGKCRETSIYLTNKFTNNEQVNDRLYQEYANNEKRYQMLKNMASNKLYKERKLSNEKERKVINISNNIPVHYNKLLAISKNNNPVKLSREHNKLKMLKTFNIFKDNIKNRSNGDKINLLVNPESDLLNGNDIHNFHPYKHGIENDNVFNTFSVKKIYLDVNKDSNTPVGSSSQSKQESNVIDDITNHTVHYKII